MKNVIPVMGMYTSDPVAPNRSNPKSKIYKWKKIL